MNEAPLKVLCVTGWCRNGSTIIGNILNEIPGFCHVGELHFLWKNAAGKGTNSQCGCGQSLTRCPLWSEVVGTVRPGSSELAAYADEVTERQRACVRTRHTWRVLRHALCCTGVAEHAALMSRTYAAVAARTGARVIVDTTKIPGEAALLPHVEGVDPYFVHLVRDPRAVAASWRRPKQYVHTLPAGKSTAYWIGFNLAAHAVTRRYPEQSLFLRYEDFIADPAGTVNTLLRLCGADRAVNPVTGRTVELRTNHTVTGNPDRFRTGTVVIRETDDSWRASLPAHARLMTVMLSWPLSGRYGYRHSGAA